MLLTTGLAYEPDLEDGVARRHTGRTARAGHDTVGTVEGDLAREWLSRVECEWNAVGSREPGPDLGPQFRNHVVQDPRIDRRTSRVGGVHHAEVGVVVVGPARLPAQKEGDRSL